MFIFDVKCAAMSGSNPKPVNVDLSVRGALLGFTTPRAGCWSVETSILGFDVNREDMICVGLPGPDDFEVLGAS